MGARPGEPDRRAHRLQRRVRAAAGAGAGRGRGRPRRPSEPVLRVRSVAAGGRRSSVALADIAPGAVDGLVGLRRRGRVGAARGRARRAGAGRRRRRRHPVRRGPVVVGGAGVRRRRRVERPRRAGLVARRRWPRPPSARRTTSSGAPTGVMDQMASLHGRAGHLVFLDMRSLAVEQVPFDPPAAGLALLVIDTQAPHAHVDGEYAERRRSCEQAARDPRRAGAARRHRRRPRRRAGPARRGEATCSASGSGTSSPRTRGCWTVVAALRAGDDPRTIGPTLTASHASMRDDFEITVPEVDTAVAAALDAGAHGARMTGGGFGGCVLALVEADAVERGGAGGGGGLRRGGLPAAGGVRGRRPRRRPPPLTAAARPAPPAPAQARGAGAPVGRGVAGWSGCATAPRGCDGAAEEDQGDGCGSDGQSTCGLSPR